MKTGNAALLVAAGILLIIIVATQRTKNLSSAWATLMQPGGASGGGSGGFNLGNLTWGGSIPNPAAPSGTGIPVGGTPTDPGATPPPGEGGQPGPINSAIATIAGGPFAFGPGTTGVDWSGLTHGALAVPQNIFGPAWNRIMLMNGTIA